MVCWWRRSCRSKESHHKPPINLKSICHFCTEKTHKGTLVNDGMEMPFVAQHNKYWSMSIALLWFIVVLWTKFDVRTSILTLLWDEILPAVTVMVCLWLGNLDILICTADLIDLKIEQYRTYRLKGVLVQLFSRTGRKLDWTKNWTEPKVLSTEPDSSLKNILKNGGITSCSSITWYSSRHSLVPGTVWSALIIPGEKRSNFRMHYVPGTSHEVIWTTNFTQWGCVISPLSHTLFSQNSHKYSPQFFFWIFGLCVLSTRSTNSLNFLVISWSTTNA